MSPAEKRAELRHSASGEYLTFALDGEVFAIEVERVREVVDPPQVTFVPNAPDHARGLINVRGNVVPFVDLRRRFGMPPSADESEVRVIVAEVPMRGDAALVAIKADAVYEVIDASRVEIDDIPRLGTRWRAEFIKGVVKSPQGFVILLAIEQVLLADIPGVNAAA